MARAHHLHAAARLQPIALEGAQGRRANALWDIGLLGNRGIRQDRAFAIIGASLHDPNVNVRYWAVEGLAFLGTDQVIEPLLDVFHDDPSPMIRERAACSLAQSGRDDALSPRACYRKLSRRIKSESDLTNRVATAQRPSRDADMCVSLQGRRNPRRPTRMIR